jgi:hypothetical protein
VVHRGVAHDVLEGVHGADPLGDLLGGQQRHRFGVAVGDLTAARQVERPSGEPQPDDGGEA